MIPKLRWGAGGLVALGTLVLSPSATNAAGVNQKVVAVQAPDDGRPVVAKCDSQGTIHLVYETDGGPQYVNSSDNGKTFTRAMPIVDRGSRKPGLEFSAWDLAVGEGGSVHVALSTNAWKLKLPEEEWGYFYGRLAPGAKQFVLLRNINRKPSEGFSLAADGRGNLTACWLSDKLYVNVSHDDGKSFGPNVELDTTFNPCNCCTTSCAYGSDGKLAILYREETNNERDMYLVAWDQKSNRVDRTRASGESWSVDACPMTYYSVSPGPQGFVAAWPTRGDIYFARLDNRGRPLFPEVKTAGKSGMRTGVLALSDPQGNSLVVWSKDSQLGWQLYDPQGRPLGPMGSAQGSGNGAAGVLTKDGRFVLFH